MYELTTLQESVRVPPKFLGEDAKDSVKKALQESVEGFLDKELGIVLCVTNVKDVGEGKIIPGDGAVYYDATFEALIYRPEVGEVVDGEVIELVEFGAFVRLGPIDGLVHISQITDEFMSYSKDGVIATKDNKRNLKVGDKVRARIVTLSLKQTTASKLGLTMRQNGLGKLDWLKDEKQQEKK